MCNWHNAQSKSTTYGWSVSHGYSTTEGTSEVPPQDILSDVDVGRSHADKLHIDIMLRTLRKHLQQATRRLSVVQFAELRRRYDDIWLEVLGEL